MSLVFVFAETTKSGLIHIHEIVGTVDSLSLGQRPDTSGSVKMRIQTRLG